MNVSRLVGATALAALAAATSASVAPGAASSPPAEGRVAALTMMARPNAGATYLGRDLSWGPTPEPDQLCHPTLPFCVHWATAGDQATPPTDDDHDGTPDQVDRTMTAVAASWDTIVGRLGFKPPLPDDRSQVDGGSDDLDVYLADTGRVGLSGFTSSDDPRLADGSGYRFRDVSAFIVLDNDFRKDQFPVGTALDNLRVAAAHELFHAVEMAYDYREDPWLAEGSATWVEDRVADDANLNVRYLQRSSAAAPLIPLDLGRKGYQYGSWLFLRYLSEHFGPRIVTRIWRLADDSPDQVSARDTRTYSMAAARRAVARTGHDFADVVARFMTANLTPGRSYREGAANSYPRASSVPISLGRRGSDSGWLGLPLDHLSATYATFVPADPTPSRARLRIRVDGPPRAAAPRATVVVHLVGGRDRVRSVPLTRNGKGVLRVGFGSSVVEDVDVALVNASTRYRDCFAAQTTVSCQGEPRDDHRGYRVRARVM